MGGGSEESFRKMIIFNVCCSQARSAGKGAGRRMIVVWVQVH